MMIIWQHRVYNYPREALFWQQFRRNGKVNYNLTITGNCITIPKPLTHADVCRNTLVYQLARRKQRDGTFTGRILIEQGD